jgi:hypothetical protein
MAKPYSERLSLLKSILAGKEKIEAILPPMTYLVVVREKGKYELNNRILDQEEYDKWCETVREMDTVIKLEEIRTYSADTLNEP